MHPAMTLVQRYVPVTTWLPSYDWDDMSGDLVAGTITAIMLVPQSMAYALLAGLPPQVGLYASIVPLILYSVFGSSRVLAVGPVALVSLLVASTLGELEASGSADYISGALLLAGLVGVISLVMGLLRVGFLVTFLSHPVISGFTSAAALIIGFSQLKHIVGLDIPRTDNIVEVLTILFARLGEINPSTLVIGVGGVAVLLAVRGRPGRLITAKLPSAKLGDALQKTGPLLLVALATLIVWQLGLDQGPSAVAIVGDIPAGLPPLTLPVIDLALARELLPAAALISFIGFLESVSVAKALASKQRQKIDPDQELIGLGFANIGAAVTGGYPVTGGFSRSSVNYAAGARTPMAAVLTALLVAVTVLVLTPLFFFLPKAALAAIIVVAVANLVDIRGLIEAWRYNVADGLSFVATFVAVLTIGVEAGILLGVGVSLALYLWRTSRPHMAIVGRVGATEHFRNVLRHDVFTVPSVLTVRVDESLYFANAANLEVRLLGMVAEQPEVEHLVLICSAVNQIDASALESLQNLSLELADAGVTLHLAEVKGPVMDRLSRSGFLDSLGDGRVFLSTHEAMQALTPVVASEPALSAAYSQ